MPQIVLDAALRERLQDVREVVDFLDDEGHLIGTFCPLLRPPYDKSLIPAISPAERAALMAQPGQYTTQEVLQHLESL